MYFNVHCFVYIEQEDPWVNVKLFALLITISELEAKLQKEQHRRRLMEDKGNEVRKTSYDIAIFVSSKVSHYIMLWNIF